MPSSPLRRGRSTLSSNLLRRGTSVPLLSATHPDVNHCSGSQTFFLQLLGFVSASRDGDAAFGWLSAFTTRVKEAKLHDVFLCDLHFVGPRADRRLALSLPRN